MKRVGVIAACLLSVVLYDRAAWGRGPEEQRPSSASTDPQEEARLRFKRGVQLYEEGDYKLALIEFERVYALVPNYKLLYNIGQVQQQLGHYALALDALRRYLDEGESRIPADRRKQVEQDIAALRARTAILSVKVSVPDAEIWFDGDPLGRDAIENRLVDAGKRRVRVTKPGFIPDERTLVLAGGDTIQVDVILRAVPVAAPAPSLPPAEKPSRPEIWIGWGTTAALAAGAGVVGALALSNASTLDDQRNTLSTTAQGAQQAQAERESTRKSAEALFLTADILGAAAVVAGGVALYLTIRKPSDKPKVGLGGPSFRAQIGPTMLGGRVDF